MFFLLVFLLSGVAIANTVLDDKQGLVNRIWIGLVFGCLELMWLPAGFSLITGRFSLTEQWLALGTAILAGSACVAWEIFKQYRPMPLSDQPEVSPKPLLDKWDIVGLVIALAITGLCTYLLHTHVIRAAADGSLHVGQSTYGDLNMHLGMVENLFVQGQFPPEYNILPGQTINYPFLVNAASATLRFGGLSLRMAVILPSVVMIFCIVLGFYAFAAKLTRKGAASVLATTLFFLNGGFGFAYFLDKIRSNPENFKRIFTAFYETPTNYTAVGNVKWVNVICDMIIPQRTTMAGWCVVLAALWMLVHVARMITAREEDSTKFDYRYFALLGVIGGLMPMVHTHSFFALGMISAGVFFACLPGAISKARGRQWFIGFCIFGGITLVLALPQLITWTFRSAGNEGFLQWHLDWANADDNWLWFWIKNAGVVFLLALPALLNLRGSDKVVRRAMAIGSLIIFAVGSVAVFQPNFYDNNKLFYVGYMIICAVVGEYMCDLYQKLKGVHGRSVIAAIVLTASVLSGVLTIAREWVSDYQLLGAEEVAAAEYISENTEPDAVFMAYPNHNNAVAVLTGRRITVGAGTFLYFHGVDYQERQAKVEAMFRDGDTFAREYESMDIDYIYIGPYERSNYEIDYDWFNGNCQKIYDDAGVELYKVKSDE